MACTAWPAQLGLHSLTNAAWLSSVAAANLAVAALVRILERRCSNLKQVSHQLDQTGEQKSSGLSSSEGLTQCALGAESGLASHPAQTPHPTEESTSSLDAPAQPVWRVPLLAGAAAACGCVAIALINPTDTGVTVCWSRAVFGVDCPLCGGLRATNDLVRGRFYEAAGNNVLVAIALPIVALVWVVWVAMAIAGRPFRIARPPTWVIGVLAVLVASFTVLRNTGGPAWVDWLASGSYR